MDAHEFSSGGPRHRWGSGRRIRRGGRQVTHSAATRVDKQNSRPRCAFCMEAVDTDDRLSIHLTGQGSSGWFCSRECLRRLQRRAAGEQVEPYYGEQLERGFDMLHECGDY